ncbi:MAG: type IX secretion system membrane protein PorP/SprF [Sphingobacteriales bacterium]|nr:MAG: type IX secretion system membrane protein PorP/SprF [Sphingobacteriales bacterium]
MKKRTRSYIIAGVLACCLGTIAERSVAQGIHFSQYYNAPMLLNPANTSLMSDKDFRLGGNYRSQWSSIVPYNTFSAYGDFQVARNHDYSNWLGIGGAIFNDKAGDGELSLTRFEGCMAYHLSLSEVSMISGGVSVGYSQRSLNFNKLSYGMQWDGFRFDPTKLNGEKDGIIKTNFIDVGAGVNYAFFPNEAVYFKVGAGVAHVNQPTETFYNSTTGNNAGENKLSMRPTLNIDAQLRINEVFVLNPSLYFTYQAKSYQAVAGGLGMFYLGGPKERPTQLILGAYHRVMESVIAVAGMEYANTKLMFSYDYTVSSLSVENKGNGAFEMSVIYQGLYGQMGSRRTINCPRF